jgi:hypothetical protein
VTRLGKLGTLAVTSKRSTLLVIANVVSNLAILVNLMMEAIRSSETSVLTRVTRRNIPEDDILHNHRRENFKSHIAIIGWALWRRRNVSPVKYELALYILEDGIHDTHRRKNLKYYSGVSLVYLTFRLSSYHEGQDCYLFLDY